LLIVGREPLAEPLHVLEVLQRSVDVAHMFAELSHSHPCINLKEQVSKVVLFMVVAGVITNDLKGQLQIVQSFLNQFFSSVGLLSLFVLLGGLGWF